MVGIGEAAELAYKDANRSHQNKEKMELLLSELTKKLDEIHVNGSPYSGSKIVNLLFDGVDGETLLLLLSKYGICVSAGSACSAHSAKPSHVLTALGLPDEGARSSIRISFSDLTTNEEICHATQVIADSVKKLQRR